MPTEVRYTSLVNTLYFKVPVMSATATSVLEFCAKESPQTLASIQTPSAP